MVPDRAVRASRDGRASWLGARRRSVRPTAAARDPARRRAPSRRISFYLDIVRTYTTHIRDTRKIRGSTARPPRRRYERA